MAILLGEISPGGDGGGLYSILVLALLSVFIAGLMVGRTPEFLGKKIRGPGVRAHQGHAGHLRPTFAVFLLGVIVIVGGLIYFPMLILGPLGERLVG